MTKTAAALEMVAKAVDQRDNSGGVQERRRGVGVQGGGGGGVQERGRGVG